MRNTKINALYYPDMFVSETTLKKAILLFDELHFLDRPSFTLKNFGSIGATSPLRQYEESFQQAGVPFFVHGVQGGRIGGNLLDQVNSDINDLLFLKRFQDGLETSATFRNFQISPGNYGDAGNEDDVARKIISVDLSCFLTTHGTAENLLGDNKIKPFDLSSPLGCAKQLVSMAAMCSAKLNFALIESARNGFFPLADADPYTNLLGARYARAINKLELTKNHIQVTDLSFAIFDELLPTECIEKISLKDVVSYRKSSENAREEFLEYLSILQAKQDSINVRDNYVETIEKLIKTEIIPAAKIFKNKLKTIDESFFGALTKGVLGVVSGSSGISIFADLSWDKIILLGGAAGTYVLKTAVDRFLAERAIKRECSISYILSLDK